MKSFFISNKAPQLKCVALATALAMVVASCQKEAQLYKSTTPELHSTSADSSGAPRVLGMANVKVKDSAVSAAVSYIGYPGKIQVLQVQGYAPLFGTSPFLWFPKRYVWRSPAYSSEAQYIGTTYNIYKRLAGTSQWYFYDKVSPANITVPAGYSGGYLNNTYRYIDPDYRGGSYYWVKQVTVWLTMSGTVIGTNTISYNGYGGTQDYSNPDGSPNVTTYGSQIFFIGY